MPTRSSEEALRASQHAFYAFYVPFMGLLLHAASEIWNAAMVSHSVHASLALACGGARGATRRQILQVLGSGSGGLGQRGITCSEADAQGPCLFGGSQLAFTGGILADSLASLFPEFMENARNVYGSGARTADFWNKRAVF